MAKGLKIDFYFIPMPVEAFDPEHPLKEAGIRLLAYLLKHTRFGQTLPDVSYEELENGIVDASGRRKDSGCGLSRNGIRNGQKELEERGWLEAKNLSADKSRPRWKYRLILAPEKSSTRYKEPPRNRTNSPADRATAITTCAEDSARASPQEESLTRSGDEVSERGQEIRNGHSRSPQNKGLSASDGIHYSRWAAKMEIEVREWQKRNPEATEMDGLTWAQLAEVAAESAGCPKDRLKKILEHERPHDPNVDLIGQKHTLVDDRPLQKEFGSRAPLPADNVSTNSRGFVL